MFNKSFYTCASNLACTCVMASNEIPPRILKLKLDSVQPATCDLCEEERRWGTGKGRFRFYDKHNSWMTYFFLRFRSSLPSRSQWLDQNVGIGVWENIERLVKSPICVVCGEETNLGGKGKYELCTKHNSWRAYLRILAMNAIADCNGDR